MQFHALTLDKFLIHAAKWHPEAEVVTARSGGVRERATYAQLLPRARKVSALLASLGVGQGDRVATLAWNTQGHVEAWYGIMAMGAVCHTLNPRLLPEQSAAMIARSEARILFVSADLMPLAQEIGREATFITHMIVIDDGHEASLGAEGDITVLSLRDALAEVEGHADVPWGDFDERAPSGLCFTSGTTGAPKGVTYTHRANYLHTLRQLQADVGGFTSRDSVLMVVPMFHANAWGLPFAVPGVGGKLVLPGRNSDGASLASLIRGEHVTIAVGVPTVWLGLLDHLDETGTDIPSLRRIMVGGSSMPPALMERIEKRGITVQTTWGMTELSPLGTATPPAAPERDPSKSGRPALGVDLMLVDADGRALPEQRGAEGHLRVRGDAVVERYFGERSSATDDGWFDTGDLARIDGGGQITITGRAKELIKSGGEWINPAQIEAIVGELPAVSMAAVVGRADDKWGERPVLVVELKAGEEVSDEVILAPLRRRVASWWVPDEIVRLEAMPLASTGKIDKIRLKSRYSQP